ncbi:MAG: HutD family protein [Beijerinckiaceae bacterium]|nr:HutD family protein [Beijerinckiaceae bacterium]
MSITVLSPAGYRRFPWKNGGGVTVDIAAEWLEGVADHGWEGMVWRLGRTTIPVPGPFSDLAGFDRCQVVIGGAGLVLVTPEGEIDLRTPFRPVRYRGEVQITSRLEQGPVEVVNLIGDRTRVAIDLVVLGAGDSLGLKPGCHVVHAPTGPAHLRLGPEAGAADDVISLEPEHAARISLDRLSDLHCDAGPCLVASILPLRA